MATKTKKNSKTSQKKKVAKKELTPVQSLTGQIEDLENEQYEMPCPEDCYTSYDLGVILKEEIKEFPRNLKYQKVKVDSSRYIKLCKDLLAEMKNIDSKVSVLHKEYDKEYNTLQRQIDKLQKQKDKLQSSAKTTTFIY